MEKEKKSKKKVLLYYLILAACLLVIAAVTVTLVLTLGPKNPSDIIDNNPPGIDSPDDGKTPDDGKNPDDGKDPDDDKNPDDKPTSTTGVFGLPLKNAAVTAGYEFRYDETLDRYCTHQGMDFKAELGTEVCAVLEGTVAEIVTDHIIGENYVKVTHANGMTSTYKYIDAKSGLKVGDSVKCGDVLGTVAKANGMEMKQGEHLHLEISVNGKNADPDVYLDIIEK